MTYEKYCEDMKRLGHGPMDIKEFEKMTLPIKISTETFPNSFNGAN